MPKKAKKKAKTVYDGDDEYENEFLELISSKKEMIFTFGAILGICLILVFFLFSGCTKSEVTESPAAGLDETEEQEEQPSGEIIQQEEIPESPPEEPSVPEELPDFEEELPAVESEEVALSEIVDTFTIRPTCNKGYHVGEVYVKFTQLPSSYTYQLRKASEPEFSDLKTRQGEFERYSYFYICDGCPVGDEMMVLPGDDYILRVAIDQFGDVSYTEEIAFSTKEDSEYMTKICGSADLRECDDTEYEKNPKARGKITFQGEDYVEFCDSPTSTEEYWCENGEVKKEIIECEVKCWLGRCVG